MVLGLTSVGYVNQPLVGDLTRIGGFRENDFGWNAPQTEYLEVLYDQIEQLSDYDEYYDVVVLGDSFTFLDQKRSWLNFFVDKTGCKVAAFHQSKFEIIDILNSSQFVSNPPRFFIYQSVERGIVSNILFQSGIYSPELESSQNNTDLPSFSIAPLGKEKETVLRYIKKSDFENRLSEAASYILRLIKRKVFKIAKVQILPLQKETSLFSSKVKDFVLVSNRDFEKVLITDEDTGEASRKINVIQQRVESNRATEFLLLVLPDKLTVYYNSLSEKPDYRGLIGRLGRDLSFVRMDTFLQKKVGEGIEDIYMPNDTHTSSHGNELIAQMLVERLSADKSIRQD